MIQTFYLFWCKNYTLVLNQLNEIFFSGLHESRELSSFKLQIFTDTKNRFAWLCTIKNFLILRWIYVLLRLFNSSIYFVKILLMRAGAAFYSSRASKNFLVYRAYYGFSRIRSFRTLQAFALVFFKLPGAGGDDHSLFRRINKIVFDVIVYILEHEPVHWYLRSLFRANFGDTILLLIVAGVFAICAASSRDHYKRPGKLVYDFTKDRVVFILCQKILSVYLWWIIVVYFVNYHFGHHPLCYYCYFWFFWISLAALLWFQIRLLTQNLDLLLKAMASSSYIESLIISYWEETDPGDEKDWEWWWPLLRFFIKGWLAWLAPSLLKWWGPSGGDECPDIPIGEMYKLHSRLCLALGCFFGADLIFTVSLIFPFLPILGII